MPGLTPEWAEASAHASLGLPGGGPIKRVIGKLLWPFLRHQVAVNRALLAELDAVSAHLGAAEVALDVARGDLEHHTAVLIRHEEPLDRHEFLLKHLEPAIDDMVRQFELVQDKIDLGQRQALVRYHDVVGPLRAAVVEAGVRIDSLERELADAVAALASGEERGPSREGPDEAWRRSLEDVWLRLAQLDLFLAEARRAFPSAVEPAKAALLPSGFEALQTTFAEAFRGPVPVIKNRLVDYLDDLAGVDGPTLDLGCGRGELLELLASRGLTAYGIELDPSYVERGVAAGLDVRRDDARHHLEQLAPASLGAITAIQLVEHLEVDELIEIIELAARAIRPGGLLVLETQNPENVVVGASSFYLDPTHRRPMPPQLLAFLVGARGFGDIEIRRFERAEQPAALAHPKPDEPWSEPVGALVDVVNAHLFAPADYAVVGRRP